MKPEYQTKWGKGKGNCFQYALASILELDPNIVPDFCNEYGDNWHKETVKWLNQFGLSLMTIEPEDKLLNHYSLKDCVLLVCVKDDNGVNHAVVYKNEKLIHDPNFWYDGKYKIEAIDFIFLINPADAVRNGKVIK